MGAFVCHALAENPDVAANPEKYHNVYSVLQIKLTGEFWRSQQRPFSAVARKAGP